MSAKNSELRSQLADVDARQAQQLGELGELRRSLRTSETSLAEIKVMAKTFRERADEEAAKVVGLQNRAADAQAKVDGQLNCMAFLERKAADAVQMLVPRMTRFNS